MTCHMNLIFFISQPQIIQGEERPHCRQLNDAWSVVNEVNIRTRLGSANEIFHDGEQAYLFVSSGNQPCCYPICLCAGYDTPLSAQYEL